MSSHNKMIYIDVTFDVAGTLKVRVPVTVNVVNENVGVYVFHPCLLNCFL